MSVLPPRVPTFFNFSSPAGALSHIRMLHQQKQTITLFDAVEEVVRRFPVYSVPILALAYDYYQELQDKSRYEQYQARVFDFGIRPGDKVLDIGSGHSPFPLATHLADLTITDDKLGRAGTPFKPLDDKPVYECSVEQTPFADKEFDFVYCSHVLEHTPHPETACLELMRIAKKGYIETPTKGKDIFLGSARTSHHLAYVELIHNVLTFTPYEDWQLPGIGHDILMQMHCSPQTDREKAFSALIYLFPRTINTMLLWENSFEFKCL